MPLFKTYKGGFGSLLSSTLGALANWFWVHVQSTANPAITYPNNLGKGGPQNIQIKIWPTLCCKYLHRSVFWGHCGTVVYVIQDAVLQPTPRYHNNNTSNIPSRWYSQDAKLLSSLMRFGVTNRERDWVSIPTRGQAVTGYNTLTHHQPQDAVPLPPPCRWTPLSLQQWHLGWKQQCSVSTHKPSRAPTYSLDTRNQR